MHLLLTRELAANFVSIALAHVTREFPVHMNFVLTDPSDVCVPRALHPIFYGSFDWHSCVHGYWLLTRAYRLFPDLPHAVAIRALCDEHFTPENVAAEMNYFDRPMQGSFERPYGWAWLLALQSELVRHRSVEAERWRAHLAPLATALAQRLKIYFTKLPHPVRAGTHGNTAFAMTLAADYAESCGDPELLKTVRARAVQMFGQDIDCQAMEPGGNDFLSPMLIEIECMRRTLPAAQFADWLARFAPRLSQRRPAVLFEPVAVPDRTDPQIVHLDGLNLSRAWCWRALAAALPSDDPRRQPAIDAGEAHLRASLPHLAGDYMGEHWLATFAMLALTAWTDVRA